MRSCGACDATIDACLSAEVQEERRSRQAAAASAETATQSQMQVEIRSMRALRFGDSKKLVVHTWPARPSTRSYQPARLGRPLVLDRVGVGLGLPVARFTWSCLGSSTLRWRFLRLLQAASPTLLDSDSFMNNAIARVCLPVPA